MARTFCSLLQGCASLLEMDAGHFHIFCSTPILAGMTPAALDLLATEGHLRTFAPVAWIVREGTTGHSLFIILEGDVAVVKQHDDHEVLLARLHHGTFFGEMCVVDPVPRAASVRAENEVTALEVSSATIYHLFQKLPEEYAILLLNLLRDLARRLRTLDEAFAAKS